jgi:hypothetical protein
MLVAIRIESGLTVSIKMQITLAFSTIALVSGVESIRDDLVTRCSRFAFQRGVARLGVFSRSASRAPHNKNIVSEAGDPYCSPRHSGDTLWYNAMSWTRPRALTLPMLIDDLR